MSQFIANVKAHLIDDELQTLRNLKDQIVNVKVNLTGDGANFVKSFNSQLSSLTNTSAQAGAKIGQNISNGAKTATTSLNGMASSATKASKAFSIMDATTASNKTLTWLNNNSKAAKQYGDALKNLAERQRKATSKDELSAYAKEFRATTSEAKLLGLTGRTAFGELGRGFKQIGQFVGTYGVYMKAVETLKKMATAVKDVDDAMTELRKVTDAPMSQVADYFDEAAESAKKYGQTISDVIKNTADWQRLGYNLKDAKQLSDMTTLYQNVGDNMTQESASESMVSTLQGFQMAADEAEHIVDAFNEVGNNFAIGSDGIGEALKRSASSMYAANNTMEETIGLVTAANEVVQDPASVGTAFKTISMRIRGAKTELQAMGEETEGMADSTAELRDKILGLAGVDIMIDEDTFKSTYQIMDELSQKWGELTDIQQASITELIAGKRQGNVVSALMNNFDTARAATETAMNSTGSAMKENERYMESLSGKIGTFKAQFQELSNVTLDSDFLKGAVDAGTKLLEILTKIIDVGNGIPAMFGAIGAIKLFRNRD